MGIHDNDLIVIDRSVSVEDGDIVANHEGEFVIRTLQKLPRPALVSADPATPAIHLHDESDLRIWGVITHSIHKTLKLTMSYVYGLVGHQ